MRLPNGELAVVPIAKLRDYCLSATHPRGRHKARVFLAALGMTADDAEALREALLKAALQREALEGVSDMYGTRYLIDFPLIQGNATARIRSSWIVRRNEIAPQFVTCFIL